MKLRKHRTISLAVVLAFASTAVVLSCPVAGNAQSKNDAPPDQSKHASTPLADLELASQIAELRVKVARLEAALNQGPKATPSATPDAGGLEGKQDKAGVSPPGGRVSAKFQNCIQCHQTRPSGPLPPSHLEIAGDKDMATKEGGMAGMGDNKKPAGGMAGMGDKGMMDEKKKAGMGMMDEKKKAGMGMMDEKKKAGMGMMDEKKGMAGMEGGKAGMGGSTTVTLDQQKMQMMKLKMQMMELKMQMMEKGAATGMDQTASEPHAAHTGTPPGKPDEGAKMGVQDKAPDPGKLTDKPVDADKDLLAQVRELQARIAKLEAASKHGP